MEAPALVVSRVLASDVSEVTRLAGGCDDDKASASLDERGADRLVELLCSPRLWPLREFVEDDEIGDQPPRARRVGRQHLKGDIPAGFDDAIRGELDRASEVRGAEHESPHRVQKQPSLVAICCQDVEASSLVHLYKHRSEQECREIRCLRRSPRTRQVVVPGTSLVEDGGCVLPLPTPCGLPPAPASVEHERSDECKGWVDVTHHESTSSGSMG